MTETSMTDSPALVQAGTGGGKLPASSAKGYSLTRRDVALLAFGFAPLILQFFGNLWERQYYQFFPMALAGAVFLAWDRLKEMPRPFASGPVAGTVALVGTSFALLFAAMVLWSPWLASWAAVLFLLGFVWCLGGGSLLWSLLPAFVLGLTIIPPPLSLDVKLMLYLQELAVHWSSQLLDTLSVMHFLSGNVIELPQQKLLVEEACSGINSVLLTLAASLFYLMWRRRSVIRILVCVPLALSGVLIGNVFRITLGGWLKYNNVADILTGWRHEMLGLFLVAAYLILIVSLDRLWDFLISPMWKQEETPATTVGAVAATPAVAESNSVPTLGSLRVAMRWLPGLSPRWVQVAVYAFALLGLAELGRGWLYYRQSESFAIAHNSALPAGAVFTLPERLGEWQRLDSATPGYKAEVQGISSKIWRYQRGQTVASVALDYPFRGYHDVTVCYRKGGWNITRQELQPGNATNSIPPLMAVQMDKEPASEAFLWFSTVDEQRRWMEMPAVKLGLLERLSITGFGFVPTSYRMQVLLAGYGTVSAEDQKAARQLFDATRQLLAQQLFDQLKPKS